jgi:hypothetical protein
LGEVLGTGLGVKKFGPGKLAVWLVLFGLNCSGYWANGRIKVKLEGEKKINY